MLEKLGRIKNYITSHVLVFAEPERGIEIEFVFGPEHTAEEFEGVLGDLKARRPDLFNPLAKIIGEASNKTQKERAKYVGALTAPVSGILIARDARGRRESQKNLEQFLIGMNSMSETNLANMQRAIDNLKEVDQ